ncbi:uncharacterized protein IWZ02DRAFT_434343 [Phyllosticta citriasiana]|uniref:Uncharacterized protein n=1 Tax=Phyllosticta citriasiana TaxID=595635 RepID=A0ABR1KR61_9PEZI
MRGPLTMPCQALACMLHIFIASSSGALSEQKECSTPEIMNSNFPDSNSYGPRSGSAAYSGGTRYGSGTTSGAGFGNKTGSFSPSDRHGMLFRSSDANSQVTHTDSTLGKLMEKAGGILRNSSLEAKGLHKREEAGFTHEKKGEVADPGGSEAS